MERCCREVLGEAGLDEDLLEYVCSTLTDEDDSNKLAQDIELGDVQELLVPMLLDAEAAADEAAAVHLVGSLWEKLQGSAPTSAAPRLLSAPVSIQAKTAEFDQVAARAGPRIAVNQSANTEIVTTAVDAAESSHSGAFARVTARQQSLRATAAGRVAEEEVALARELRAARMAAAHARVNGMDSSSGRRSSVLAGGSVANLGGGAALIDLPAGS